MTMRKSCLCRSPSAEMRHAINEFVRWDKSQQLKKIAGAKVGVFRWCPLVLCVSCMYTCLELCWVVFTQIHSSYPYYNINIKNVIFIICHNSYGICGAIVVLCHFNECLALTFIFNSLPISPKYSAISADISSSLKCGLMAMAAKPQS